MTSTNKSNSSKITQNKTRKVELILDAAQELLESEGSFKLTSEALAEKMNMSSRGNIYHYFTSKRELWFALRGRYLNSLKNKFIRIKENHNGSKIDLMLKLSEFFLEFCSSNKEIARFMFLYPPPKSTKIGSYEAELNVTFPLIEFIQEIVEEAIKHEEIYNYDSLMITIFLFQIGVGAAMVENAISRLLSEGKVSLKEERIETGYTNFIDENREFYQKQLRKFLTMMRK
ncbi:MAG: TetR/AcrR family transcriptional regulator [Promethearchaeota archaeon]|jgi:AcrR family transcriptional regulator